MLERKYTLHFHMSIPEPLLQSPDGLPELLLLLGLRHRRREPHLARRPRRRLLLFDLAQHRGLLRQLLLE